MNLPHSEIYAKTLILEELNPKDFKKKINVRISDDIGSYSSLQCVRGYEGQGKGDREVVGERSIGGDGKERPVEDKDGSIKEEEMILLI